MCIYIYMNGAVNSGPAYVTFGSPASHLTRHMTDRMCSSQTSCLRIFWWLKFKLLNFSPPRICEAATCDESLQRVEKHFTLQTSGIMFLRYRVSISRIAFINLNRVWCFNLNSILKAAPHLKLSSVRRLWMSSFISPLTLTWPWEETLLQEITFPSKARRHYEEHLIILPSLIIPIWCFVLSTGGDWTPSSGVIMS